MRHSARSEVSEGIGGSTANVLPEVRLVVQEQFDHARGRLRGCRTDLSKRLNRIKADRSRPGKVVGYPICPVAPR